MMPMPDVKPGDWIEIGLTHAVVTAIRSPQHPMGSHCEVVFDASKPTNHDVRWNGNHWEFIKSGDFGGYADKYPRLRQYVSALKRGRWA
jgi:hypothetical protein